MVVFVEDIREVNLAVIELSRSRAIFWALADSATYERYSKEIDDHRDFFDAVLASSFRGFCVIAYQLFDKRSDIKSLRSLINYLSSLDPPLKHRLESNIDAQKPLLDRYFTYRHKIYAHRDKTKPPWEVFGEVPKPRLQSEMEAIVRLAQDCVSALAGAGGVENKDDWSEELRHREEYARKDALLILEALKKVS